jgi:RimJ/RimL family protein N-acetyltransferase
MAAWFALQVAGAAPAGWYLLGLAAGQAWRRRGIGEELTRAQMTWVAERSPRMYCFTGRGNPGSQALHKRLGFARNLDSARRAPRECTIPVVLLR